MTKYQRARQRIIRDKRIKEENRREKLKDYDNFDRVITEQHYYKALKKCRKGVPWKDSVQIYVAHAVMEVHSTKKDTGNGRLPNLKRTKRIEIRERGKTREIVPIRIDDRITQRVICDYSLVPVLTRKVIYDNGASMAGKGVEFTRMRMEQNTRKSIRQYGPHFYTFTYDFRKFFDSIPHVTCDTVLRGMFEDDRIPGMIMDIIRSYEKALFRNELNIRKRNEAIEMLEKNMMHGICLGSQISQSMALVVPDSIDHLATDIRGMKRYMRYMDDGNVSSDNRELLESLYEDMKKEADRLGLSFNEKKTHIVPSSKGFTFMKVRYRVSRTGKLIRTIARSSATRMRRKLKRYKDLKRKGKMSEEDIYVSMQSWMAHAKVAPSYRTVKNMLKLYREVNGTYKNDTLIKVLKQKNKNYMTMKPKQE